MSFATRLVLARRVPSLAHSALAGAARAQLPLSAPAWQAGPSSSPWLCCASRRTFFTSSTVLARDRDMKKSDRNKKKARDESKKKKKVVRKKKVQSKSKDQKSVSEHLPLEEAIKILRVRDPTLAAQTGY